MNPLTLEWVQKAEGDHAVVQCLLQAAAAIHHDAICFHAQQCVEKYLKAWLQEANIPIRKSHDLEDLLDAIVPTMPAWDAWRSDFVVITTHAVDFRYPGKSALPADSQHAVRVCDQVRQTIRASLGLTP
jgi:HEPN domain-containing protein